MMRCLAPVFACFGLALGDATAQYFPARPPTTAAATTVKATLAVPHAKVPAASPIHLELTLTTTGAWRGTPHLSWERRDPATGAWTPFVDKTVEEACDVEARAATTLGAQTCPSAVVLWQLTPGTWRVKATVRWLDVDHKPHAQETAWCEIQIEDHAANQAAMRDTRHGLVSPWQWVVTGSPLSDDVVIPAHLQGKGLLPVGTPMADKAKQIEAMRDSGVSDELALAADLILLRRDVRRLRHLADGPARAEAAKAPRARLEALAKANPITPTPLGGRHGDVLRVLVPLLRLVESDKAAEYVDLLRKTNPLLADQLAADPIW